MSLLGTVLRSVDKIALHTEKLGEHTHLITEDHSRVSTQFKATTHSTATTTAVTTPPSGGILVLTDLIVTSERRSGGGVVTVRFTDGSNNVDIFVGDLTDGPINMGIAFAGRWRGWKDARIDFITSAATDSTVSVGYYFLKGEGVLEFADWDSQR